MSSQRPYTGIDAGSFRDNKADRLKNLEAFKSYFLDKFIEKPSLCSAIWPNSVAVNDEKPSLEDELMAFKKWIVN